ncbi:glutamine amidotransferase [Micrococcales bacterium 31B]|nr:glutamine amidotransferase [Micrococcales bacterium 31B]
MSAKTLRIVHLYPRDMNIYGDWGNVLTLAQRSRWHGYEVEIVSHNPGDQFPADADLVVGGGGQDSGQTTVAQDLVAISEHLRELAERDVPILVICGLYQMLGNRFVTVEGDTIPGIGLFDLETVGGPKRMIGNIVTSSFVGDLIGYENHSGVTRLGTCEPLATVVAGDGNNGEDRTEGARYRNVLGTYLHGSLLPKNPALADWMIETAATNRFGEFTRADIDDSYAERARDIARSRPR